MINPPNVAIRPRLRQSTNFTAVDRVVLAVVRALDEVMGGRRVPVMKGDIRFIDWMHATHKKYTQSMPGKSEKIPVIEEICSIHGHLEHFLRT